LKTKKVILYAVVIIALIALIIVVRQRVHFQWSIFADQIKNVSWTHVLLALIAIYLNYLIRGIRWAFFLRPVKRVPILSLVGSQVIGFTAVAIFGRLADLVRPYLIAKRTSLTVSSQIAVYTVERMFDLGSMALIFSLVLLFTPNRGTLPHHDLLQRSAIVGLALTVFLAVFAFAVHWSGLAVANMAEKILGALSPKLGAGVASKIREFREGLNALTGFTDFLIAAGLSMFMWVLITASYIEVCHAFVASPELSQMDLARVIVLQASSLAGSIVQLPVIGWFTTIGVVSATMQTLFQVQSEPALGCSTLILLITSMGIIPVGLIWSRFEHVSLKNVTHESESLEEQQLGLQTEA
jgi:glycosyltransferase 2 family protein